MKNLTNLKSRDKFLMEKLEVSIINEAGIQSNNTKWSETMIGKLFNFVFNVVTLNGFLVDKFKDAFGAKSFILKNLARRLEKAIDKLPGEYVKRNEEVDFQTLSMNYYDEIIKIIDLMQRSKDVPVGKIYEQLERSKRTLESTMSELDPKDEEQSKIILEIKNTLKLITPIYDKVKDVVNELTDSEAASKTGYNLEKSAEALGDKLEYKRKLDDVKARLVNVIKDSKDASKISTESMFNIISILNKARSIYMEEEGEGETYYRGNKRETMFKSNKRLFDLWSEKVLKILSRKSSIIPKKLLAYINSSLSAVDPLQYNFQISPGVEKNILDELADVDTAMNKVKSKFERNPVTPRDVIPLGKSTSNVLHLKSHERIAITQETLLRGMIALTAKVGNTFTFNEKRDDTVQNSFIDKTLIFVPTRTYVNGMVLGVVSFSANVFQGAQTTSGTKIKVEDLSFDQDEFWRHDPHYYWGVLNKKDLALDSNFMIKIFNSGVTITPDRLTKMDESSLFESVVFNKLGKMRALYGNDDKVVEIDKNYLEKKFNFSSTGYRSIEQYFNSNKF